MWRGGGLEDQRNCGCAELDRLCLSAIEYLQTNEDGSKRHGQETKVGAEKTSGSEIQFKTNSEETSQIIDSVGNNILRREYFDTWQKTATVSTSFANWREFREKFNAIRANSRNLY